MTMDGVNGARPEQWLFPDPGILRRLERMTVAAKGRVRGTLQGKRRSRTLGSSLEFADYRPYSQGDDIRRLDWNVYGRTGKAFIRQYWDEQEITVHLYVDVTTSMKFIAGSGGAASYSDKLAYALRLAACVGYTALSGEDRVTASCFADEIMDSLPTMRGKASAARLFAFLAEAWTRAGSSGSQQMSRSFAVPGALPRRPGQAWLFTDGLYESGFAETLDVFLAAGQEVVFVHVLGPEELDPVISGELRLIDAESGSGMEVAIGEGVMSAYKAAVREHREWIRRLCVERGFSYVSVDTSFPLEETAIRTMLASGLLKG